MNKSSCKWYSLNRLCRSVTTLIFLACTSGLVNADNFGSSNIQPLIPIVNGRFQLPDSPAGNRLNWLIGELASNEFTSTAEIQENFTGAFDTASIQSFINDTLRQLFPDARIIDVVGIAPVQATVVIDSPGGQDPFGFLSMGVDFAGQQRINSLSVSDFFGSVQFIDDQNLNMNAAANEFQSLGAENSLFVGYINNQNQCMPVTQRSSSTPRGTGSIFKTWVLGAVASDVADGVLDRNDPIPLDASEFALGGTINSEPVGTIFTLQEMATLMMVISDNTATDHLHELVGRELVGDIVQQYGVADPDILLPFLSVSEQFHLFFSFPFTQSLAYVTGTEAFQQQFLNTQIVPLGPTVPLTQPFFHESLLTEGAWSASPMDICNTLAGLRSTPATNGAFELVDEAMGFQAAQPGIRNQWDRVWYKGGSLSSGNGFHVLTHAWLLENSGEFPRVVVAMANNPTGNIDQFMVQSLTSRMIENLADADIPSPPETDFEINVGIAGSWFNPDTNGQGWVFDLVNNDTTQLLASAWFTFDNDAPSANRNGFGDDRQRWFSANGNFSGNSAELQIFSPSGGVFNDPGFSVDRGPSVGTMTVTFFDCSNGQIAFDFNDPGVADDVVPIRRITSSTLCQGIADGQITAAALPEVSKPLLADDEFSTTSDSGFDINVGIAGSWFNPDTNGQGWVFDLVNNDTTQLLASAWFTFDTGMPQPVGANEFGNAQQRWFSANGNFSGDSAVLQIFSPSGGVFNDAGFMVDRGPAVGTMTVTFSDCTNGQIDFDFDDPDIADDTVAIRRITSSALCQAIADGQLTAAD